MHDPMTVAHKIYLGNKKKKNGEYRMPIITIWHFDPEKDGTDDSCGWFMRERHGKKEMLEKIKKSLDFEFDRVFKSGSGATYYVGYFKPISGHPNFSTMGITLDMFSKAAWEFFGYDRRKQKKWMKENLYDILHFAENNTDSLKDSIKGTFRVGCNDPWNREKALNHYASIIYGWLLRSTRKWWQHPRWHIHHWRIQFHPWKRFKRRFIDKCSICAKRGFTGAVYSDWNGTKRWCQKCEDASHKQAPKPTQL